MFDYGAAGSLDDKLSRISAMNTVLDPSGSAANVAEFEWSGTGRRVRQTFATGKIIRDSRAAATQADYTLLDPFGRSKDFGRITKVTDRAGTPKTVAEYKYNGLNQRIGWHYDTTRSGGGTADGTVDDSDPWYWFVMDDRWRIVNTYRVAKISGTWTPDASSKAKERFVHHAAGMDGWGGSSYIDAMVLSDRDTSSGWVNEGDATLEGRYFYLQNWRADTCAIANGLGIIVRNFRYTAYGSRTEVAGADYNRDGATDFFDYLDFTEATGPRTDFNRDGAEDGYDYLDFVDVFSLAEEEIGGGSIRNLYAGYENDPSLEVEAASSNAGSSALLAFESYYHVRNRVYSTDLGRWTRRDPIGYRGRSMGLYEYCRSGPETRRDALGLACGSCVKGNDAPYGPPDPRNPPTESPLEPPCRVLPSLIPETPGYRYPFGEKPEWRRDSDGKYFINPYETPEDLCKYQCSRWASNLRYTHRATYDSQCANQAEAACKSACTTDPNLYGPPVPAMMAGEMAYSNCLQYIIVPPIATPPGPDDELIPGYTGLPRRLALDDEGFPIDCFAACGKLAEMLSVISLHPKQQELVNTYLLICRTCCGSNMNLNVDSWSHCLREFKENVENPFK